MLMTEPETKIRDRSPATQLAAYDIDAARDRVAPVVACTPVLRNEKLDEHAGAAVFLKAENLQITGSFKVRGAANRILSLPEHIRRHGFITCSTGNHGRAVAYMAHRLGLQATVYVTESAEPAKVQAIIHEGARVMRAGRTYEEAERRAVDVARSEHLCYIHPFDDPAVLAGQGTIALELFGQVGGIDTVVVPLSGGGLAAGIAVAIRRHAPGVRLVAVSAENASAMYQSIRAGRPLLVGESQTLASALTGGIGLGNAHTFALVRDLVDDHVLVSEAEIRRAIVYAATELKLVLEGGGAVALAAALGGKLHAPVRRVGVILSGGNIAPAHLAALLAQP